MLQVFFTETYREEKVVRTLSDGVCSYETILKYTDESSFLNNRRINCNSEWFVKVYEKCVL